MRKKTMLISVSSFVLLLTGIITKKSDAKTTVLSNSYLGRGINLLDDSNSTAPMLGSNILNINSEDAESIECNIWNAKSQYYKSTEFLLKNFNNQNEMNLSVNCPALTVSSMSNFSISLDIDKRTYKNNIYFYYSAYTIKNKYYLKDYTSSIYQHKIKDYVLDRIKEINYNPTDDVISRFIKDYGSHLIVGYNYGACCDLFYSLSSSSVYLSEKLSSSTSNKTNIKESELPFDTKVGFATKLGMTEEQFKSEVNVNYRACGVGSSNVLPSNASKEDFFDWKNSFNDNDYGCVGYTNDGLKEIDEFFPQEFEIARAKTKEYIEKHNKIEFNLKNSNDQLVFKREGTAKAGGKSNVFRWSTPEIDFQKYDHFGYETVNISIKCSFEKKTSDQGYLSVWAAKDKDDNFIWGSDNFKISKGWHEKTFDVKYQGDNNIPISVLCSPNLTLKFDAWGIWSYNIKDIEVTINFA